MERVCNNGFQKYLRSRPGASIESVKRAKEININNVGIHPFFNAYVKEDENSVELLKKMQNYKPKGVRFIH